MIEGLNRALERIERDLHGEVDVEDLARLALTSSYHLRRMFSALAGMPLSVYVRRRRMTVAAAEVVAGRPLLEVAVHHGYGSTEAFGRAFRDVHGVSPREARAGGVLLTTQPRLTFRLTIEGGHHMEHRIVTKDAFTLAGRRTTVPLLHEGINPDLAAFVEGLPDELHERLEALSDQEPAGILAVTHVQDPSREEGTPVDYLHGVATSGPVPDDLDTQELPAASWAVFEVSGPFPDALQQLWADTAAVWFPSNPYRAVDAPELLRTRFDDERGTTATCELWIMVEPDPAR